MRVRAKFTDGKYGFAHDRRVYDGDEFEIDPKQFSPSWMDKIEDEKRRGRKPAAETMAETEDGGE